VAYIYIASALVSVIGLMNSMILMHGAKADKVFQKKIFNSPDHVLRPSLPPPV